MIKMKKAAASIPLIVGLIALVIVVLFVISTQNQGFFSTNNILFSNPETAPVDNLIQSCLDNSLEKTFEKIGNNGGWITSAAFEINPEDPTDSYALPVNNNYAVAYWYFMLDPNLCEGNCRFGSLAPSLTQVEKQAEEYIALDVFKCFTENWKDDGNFKIYIKDLPSVDVILTDKNVKAKLDFPIEIEKLGEGGIKHREEYTSELDIPFKKIWTVASEIAAYEAKTRFLEVSVIDLISLYSGKDKNKLPPFYDVSFIDFSPVMWQADKVREKITQILAAYLNQITINNSKNFDFGIKTEGERKTLQGFLVWDIKDDNVKDLNISFTYNPRWKPFIAFGDQEGIIMPVNLAPANDNIILRLLDIAGVTRYRTLYQVSYPVLVDITDSKALNGRGYTFRIALEGNIRNNNILLENSTVGSVVGSPDTSICDDRFWGGEHRIKIKDFFGKPVENAEVSLYALNTICGLGKTNEGGEIITGLPEGIFTVRAYKPGYYITENLISSRDTTVVVLTAYPEKEIKVKIGKAELSKEDVENHRINFALDNFNSKEKGTFIMYNLENPKYTVTFKINGSNALEKYVNLVPGKYRIISTIIYNDTIEIPEKCVVGGELLCLKKLNGTNITNYPVSIVNIKELEISGTDLYNHNVLEISVPVTLLPEDYDDLKIVSDLMNFLSENPDKLRMRFRSE